MALKKWSQDPILYSVGLTTKICVIDGADPRNMIISPENLFSSYLVNYRLDSWSNYTVGVSEPLLLSAGLGYGLKLRLDALDLEDIAYENRNNIFEANNTFNGEVYVKYITLNSVLSAPLYIEGKIFYDNINKALSVYNDKTGKAQVLGREFYKRVKNNTASTILGGKVVYINSNSSGIPTIELARADSYTLSRAIGVTTLSIPAWEQGDVTLFGDVPGLDLSHLVDGPAYLSPTVAGELTSTKPTGGNFCIAVGTAEIITDNNTLFVLPRVTEYTVEEVNTMGFPTYTLDLDRTISFLNNTRSFYIEPATGKSSFYYYHNGIKYIQTTTVSLSITNVEGLHLIYFNGDTLTEIVNPTSSETYDIYTSYVPVAIVYWDAANSEYQFLSNDMHTIKWLPTTLAHSHTLIGTLYKSGLDPIDIATDQFSISSGVVVAEDIVIDINAVDHTVGLPIVYRDGPMAYWRKDYNTGYSYLIGNTSQLQYNKDTDGTWSLEEMQADYVTFIHVFAQNDVSEKLIAFMGTNEYIDVLSAEANIDTEILEIKLASSMYLRGLKHLYSFILTSVTALADPIALTTTSTGLDFLDFRYSNYGITSGLGGHKHFELYTPNKQTRVLTSTWDENIGIGILPATEIFARLTIPSASTVSTGYLGFNHALSASSRRWWVSSDIITYGDFGIQTETIKGSTAPDLTRFYIDPLGDIGINTTTPSGYQVNINGTLLASTSVTTPTINLVTGATLNYYWKCTNATTGAGAWASVSASQFYNGAWDANTNTPTLADGDVAPQGTYYHCVVSGTTDFDGAGGRDPIAFVQYEDDVAYNGLIWEKVPNAQYALLIMSSVVVGGAKLGSGMNVGGEGAELLNILNENKGDITVSGSGTSYGRQWAINSSAVTYTKIQNVSATNRILGRASAGAGIVEELSVVPSAVLGGSSLHVGTTSIALNRVSGAQSLTGITSIDGSAAKWTNARLLAGNSTDGSANVPFTNKFIVQGTTDTGLTGAQFLGALGTGLVKNTTTTGVLSIITDNSTNWNTAYSDRVVSAAFNDLTGILTLTQQDAGTVVVDLDGRYMLSSGQLLNDQWFESYDYAGNSANVFKYSKDNLITFGSEIDLNHLYHVPNPGINNIVHIPVTIASPVGTEHGVAIKIGTTRTLKISALSDGLGSVTDRVMVMSGYITATGFKTPTGTSNDFLMADGGVNLPNDEWLESFDYIGNPANILKLSQDNIIEFGCPVGINSLYHVINSGFNDIVDIPVNSFSTSGTEHGVGISVADQRILKVSGLSDGAGGLSTQGVTVTGTLYLPTNATVDYYWKCTNTTTGAGTWALGDGIAHNLLSAKHSDTLADTVVRGDILYGNATPKWARLPLPASPTGKILQLTATDVAWSTNPITIGTSASISGTNTGDNAVNSLYSGLVTMTYPGSGIALSTGSAWSTSITNNSSNWNTAYGWGNHASAGYLTSVTAHNLLSTTHGDTTTGTVARGDLITGQGASPKWTRLAKGAANQVLTMDGTATDILWVTPTAGVTGTGTANYLARWTSTTAIANSIIYDNGSSYVGILTPTQYNSAILNVNGSVTIIDHLYFSSGGDSANKRIYIKGDAGTSGYVLTSGGSAGTISWGAVSGTSHTHTTYVPYDGATGAVYIRTGVTYYDVHANNFISYSDRRHKTNVKPIKLEPILAEYFSYEDIGHLGEIRYGLMAQDLFKQNPELVCGNEDDGYTVKYIDLLIKEVAYLKSEVKKLKELYNAN